MNINIYELEKNDTVVVSHLGPEDMLFRLDRQDHGALFAVDEDKPVACGLLIYSAKDDGKLDLEWLYVPGSYQGNEIGSALMEEFCDMAVTGKRKTLRVTLPPEMDDDGMENARMYFLDWGFTGKKDVLVSDIGYIDKLADPEGGDTDSLFDPFGKEAPDTYRWLKNEYYGDLV